METLRKDPEHLFVYGTLRRGSNHPMARRLATQARHLGQARTPGRLYDMGWYPAAMFEADAATRIVGDVFALWPSGQLLGEIDAYEEGDPNYERIRLKVSLAEGGELLVWTYGVLAPPSSRVIPGGDFLVHWDATRRRPKWP